MSFISTRTPDGKAIPYMNVRLARANDGSDKAYDDKFTDDGGNTSFVFHESGPHTIHANFRSPNLEDDVLTRHGHPNSANRYGTASQYVPDLEAENVVITVPVVFTPSPVPVPGPITGNGTCAQWKNAVFAIFAKHGLTGVGPDNEGQGANQAPNLRATEKEIQALHPSPYVRWQFETVGNPPELKPRLFLPHDGPDPFSRWADIGDWDGPLKWDHCHD